MLKCGRYEDLIMRSFDDDLGGQEREELNRHLNSCLNCRLLSSQLSEILDTLKHTKPAEPEAHLEKLVMDRIMMLPAHSHENDLYRLARLVFGWFAGIVVLFLLAVSLAVQASGFPDLIPAGRYYLDLLTGFILDLQIAYRIIAGLFPSEIFSLFLSIQFIFIIAIFMLVLVAVKTAFGRPTGAYPDAL